MVINKRCRNIILEIIKKETMKVSELSQMFKVSQRTIRSDVEEIDCFLIENGFDPLYKNEKREITFKTTKSRVQLIYCLINQKEVVRASYTKEERLLELFYFLSIENAPIKIELIADKFMVSKSTIVKDLERLKSILRKEDIVITGTFEGIEIKSDELSIRIALLNTFFSMMDKHSITDLVKLVSNQNTKATYKVFWHLFEDVDLKFVSYCVEIMKSRLSMHLSDYAYLYTMAAFSLLLKRHEYLYKSPLMLYRNKKLSTLIIDEIFDIVQEKENGIKEEEKDYIYYILIRMSKEIYIKENKERLQPLSKKALLLCEEMNKYRIYDIEKIKDNVVLEILNISIEKSFRQEEYRNVINLKEKNSLEVYQQVQTCWQNLSMELPLNEDDYWRIGWHFISVRKQEKAMKKVLIVSDKPRSLIKILVERLKTTFNIELLGVTGLAQLEKYLKSYKVDYLVSTIHLEGYENVIEVHPLLQDIEVAYLKQFLDTPCKIKEEVKNKNEFSTIKIVSHTSNMNVIFQRIDEILQKEKVVSHSLFEIMRVNYEKTKKHVFIYHDCLLLNIREHEIVNRNYEIEVQLENKIGSFSQIKLMVCTSVSDYINHVFDFIEGEKDE